MSLPKPVSHANALHDFDHGDAWGIHLELKARFSDAENLQFTSEALHHF